MQIKNTDSTYGTPAKFMHWLIFVLIACMLAAGFLMEDMDKGPDKFFVYGLHKSVGITILAIVILRLFWKSVNKEPLLPDTLRPSEKLLARFGHLMLYALIITMPLSGWIFSSASGYSVSVFGWFTLPNLVAPNRDIAHNFVLLHGWLAWAIMIMVSLHVLAALLHHFYYKDNVLVRMLPFVKLDRNDA